MDFDLPDELKTYREQLTAFAQRDLAYDVVSEDESHTFPRDAWNRCAAFGIQGLNIPEEFGGSQAGALTIMLAMETLGHASKDNGLLFSLNAQMWAVQHPIVAFGSDEQKTRYLPGLCDGSLIGAHAMSEPGSGSDAFSLTTTATPLDEGGYVLNGSKTFVTNAPIADLILVFATTDRAKGFAGLTAFLIDPTTPGIEVGKPLKKMGLRTSPMGEVFLQDCVVPQEAMLGKPGLGMAIFNSSMEWERSCILACTVGSMQRQLERAIQYARERKQFGQPIAKFQSISHRIVDMRIRLEAGRLLLYRLGWLLDQGKKAALESALTKTFLSESFLQTSLDSLHLHGGYGYMSEYELEREVRDAIGSKIYSGTSEMQRNLAAGLMGL